MDEITEFDKAALTYDQDFTHTETGKGQRACVYSFLPELRDKQILEMNCGTGEDAVYFYHCGAKVTATDISRNMIQATLEKARKESAEIKAFYWDLSNPEDVFQGEHFDIAFSDFGGWNCLNGQQIQALGDRLHTLIKPGGKLIVVWMPSFCLWETFYFLLKRKPGPAFRRLGSKPAVASVEGVSVLTYYYSPGKLKRLLPRFKTIKIRPVGLFLPPSYLTPFFFKHKWLIRILYFWEKVFNSFAIFSLLSDHAYIEMERLE